MYVHYEFGPVYDHVVETAAFSQFLGCDDIVSHHPACLPDTGRGAALDEAYLLVAGHVFPEEAHQYLYLFAQLKIGREYVHNPRDVNSIDLGGIDLALALSRARMQPDCGYLLRNLTLVRLLPAPVEESHSK